VTLQSTRNCISQLLDFFLFVLEQGVISTILGSVPRVMLPVFLKYMTLATYTVYILTLALYHPHCATGEVRICPENPGGNTSFRRCKHRWDDDIKMDLKIQYVMAGNFFKLLCDICINCTNCLLYTCHSLCPHIRSPHSKYLCFNPLKIKRVFFIRTQCVPRCKHPPLRL
jgi:hypothetical protein